MLGFQIIIVVVLVSLSSPCMAMDGEHEHEDKNHAEDSNEKQATRSPILDCDNDPEWTNFRRNLSILASMHRTDRIREQLHILLLPAISLFERWQAAELLEFETVHQVALDQALEPGADARTHHRAETLCVLGAANMMYVLGWAAAWGVLVRNIPGFDTSFETIRFLRGANRQLKMNDLDFLEDSSWPWGSWEILRNLDQIRAGKPFLGHPSKLGCCFGWEARQLAIPGSWPPTPPLEHHVLGTEKSWGSHAESATPNAFEIPVAGNEIGVFWTSMHFVAFLDVLTVLQEARVWRGRPIIVKNHCLASEHYCSFLSGGRFGNLCSTDVRYRRLMHYEQLSQHIGRQWGGVQDFHAEDFESAREEFRAIVWPELQREHVGLFICGHPLFWCRLFEGLGDVGILGLVDEPHTLFLPQQLHDMWTEQMRVLFAQPRWLLVAWAPFHALQMRWALGLNPAYVRAMALHEDTVGAYAPEARPEEVLVTPIPQAPVVNLLMHAAALRQPRAAGRELRFRRWPQDLPCGAQCPKKELARFRCAVVWPYDVFTMKLAELYAVGLPLFVQRDLWRWAMRWSMTDATNQNASSWTGGHLGEHLRLPTAAMEEAEDANGFEDRRELTFNYTAAAPKDWWAKPWLLGLEQVATSGPRRLGPFGPLPSSPFSANRWELEPLGRTFWAGLTEYALRPHIVYFSSVWDLFTRLEHTPLAALRQRSAQMMSFHREAAEEARKFWHRVLNTLFLPSGDTTVFKGPPERGS